MLKSKLIKQNNIFFYGLSLFLIAVSFLVSVNSVRAEFKVEVLLEKTFSSTSWCNCVFRSDKHFSFHVPPNTEYVVGHFQMQGFQTYDPYLSGKIYPASEVIGNRNWYFYFPVKNLPTEGKEEKITFRYKEGNPLAYSIQIFGLSETAGELILNETSYQRVSRENISLDKSGHDNNFFFWDIFNNPNYNGETIKSMEVDNATPVGSWLSASFQEKNIETAYSYQKSFYSSEDTLQNFIASSTLGAHDNYLYNISFTSSSTPERNPAIIIPGFFGSWQINNSLELDPILHTYDNLWEAMKLVGYKQNESLFAFPYNWRQSNATNSILLKQKIDEAKESCAQAELDGYDCSKVDLIGHSMGGIVARAYIEGIVYEDDVDQMIFLATPHRGAPKSYLAWEGGESGVEPADFLVENIIYLEAENNGYLTNFSYIRNLPMASVSELLPTYDYLQDKDVNYLRPYFFNYPRNEFLEDLNSPHNLKRLDEVRVSNIVADSGASSTINSIRVVDKYYNDGRWEHGYPEHYKLPFTDRGLEYGPGDDTVPSISNKNFYNFNDIVIDNSSHLGIVSDAQNLVIEKLTGTKPPEDIKQNLIKKMLLIRIFSPANLVVIAPDGKRVGKDFDANQNINEIKDSFYSGFDTDIEFITIPNPLDGEYKIELQGTDDGEYKLSVSAINEATSTDQDFTGNIVLDQKHSFVANYSASSSDLLTELKPQDQTAPDLSIASPLENQSYLHNNKILINYEAQDDFSGLDEVIIKINDSIVSSSTINLFDYKIGTSTLSITAIDKAGNVANQTIDFNIIASINSLIADINEIHQRGWLTSGTWKKALIIQLKILDHRIKFINKQKEKLIQKIAAIQNNQQLKTKAKEKLLKIQNKKLNSLDEKLQKTIKLNFNIFDKIVNQIIKLNYLNQAGYDTIKDSVQYLKNNL